MEGYKENMIDIFEKFLTNIVDKFPETRNFIQDGLDDLLGEIHSIELPPEHMDVDTCSKSTTDANDDEVRKYIAPPFFLILNQ